MKTVQLCNRGPWKAEQDTHPIIGHKIWHIRSEPEQRTICLLEQKTPDTIDEQKLMTGTVHLMAAAWTMKSALQQILNVVSYADEHKYTDYAKLRAALEEIRAHAGMGLAASSRKADS